MALIPEAFELYEARTAERDYTLVMNEVYRDKCAQYATVAARAVETPCEADPTPESPGVLDTPELTAGECEVTIRRDRDGKQHAFRVRKCDDTPGRDPIYFIDVNADATGRLKDWVYLGLFRPDAIHDDDVVRLTKGSRYADDSTECRVARYFLIQILYGVPTSRGFTITHNVTHRQAFQNA